MKEAFICEGIRTPIGRFGGVLSSIRTDDLAALPLKKLKEDLKGVEMHVLCWAMYPPLTEVNVTTS